MLRDNGCTVVLALILTFFCDGGSSECAQSAACTCTLANGQRYDLTNLTDSGTVTVTEHNLTFYFQPCRNAHLPTNNSSLVCGKGDGVSLCAHNDVSGEMFALGTVDETKMEFPPKYNYPVLILRHGNVTTLIHLLCGFTTKTHLVLDSVEGDTQYKFVLISPHACKTDPPAKGLSTGSVLVTLFFVFSGLYFIGGVIALKFLRGATGWEMLPNHEFWCELPSLVRDGVIFTFSCFRADSYERI